MQGLQGLAWNTVRLVARRSDEDGAEAGRLGELELAERSASGIQLPTARARPRRSRTLRIPHSKSLLYGGVCMGAQGD